MKIGILGAGQLGRMLALAGLPMGHSFHFLDPGEGESVAGLGGFTRASFDDPDAMARFVASVDRVTFEFENVPAAAVARIASERPVAPGALALERSQDRLIEKQLFTELGIPTAPFRSIETPLDLKQAAAEIGLPAVIKTRRHGYDGKGQWVATQTGDLETAWRALGAQPLILEGFVRFRRELSIIGARDAWGGTVFYPLVENHHGDGILRLSLAPAAVEAELQAFAEGYAHRLLDTLQYEGVLALELFQVGDELFANEMAPRVHNSGHWTIEGAETSQFENHLRAVLGLPLGATASRCQSAMVNLIGSLPVDTDLLACPGAHLHLYAKQPRPGRKVGHVTITAESDPELRRRLGNLMRYLPANLLPHLPAPLVRQVAPGEILPVPGAREC
ncbi:MAG: 5-(carboxyamino)imidazole ribonucleotide synthase [Candidatus Eisenbacteria bacterium]|nr:5-(carboxyamino)imidazole ribonucleotide synthase [Candidatus Eisenbacteria bacterium]